MVAGRFSSVAGVARRFVASSAERSRATGGLVRSLALRVVGRLVLPGVLATMAFFPSGVLGCGGDEDGLRVEVSAEPPASAGSPGQRFTTDLGYEVRLQSAYVASGGVELKPCAGAGQGRGRAGIAWAHSAGSPTRLGDSFVLSLGPAASGRKALGTMAPPPGRYCGLALDLQAADADARELPDGSMVGLSLRIEGFFRAPGASDEVAFSASTRAAASATAALALELADGGVEQAQVAARWREVRWFDGIDMATATPEQLGRAALQAAVGAFEAGVP